MEFKPTKAFWILLAVLALATIGILSGSSTTSGTTSGGVACVADSYADTITYTYPDGFVDVKPYTISDALDCQG